MAPRTIKVLSNTATNEVSLVRRAANRHRYALTKSEDTMNPILNVINTKAAGEDELIAVLKSQGADKKKIDALVATYRLTKGFADVTKGADFAAVAKAAGLELPAVESAPGTDPAAKAKKDDDGDDDEGAMYKKVNGKMVKMKKADEGEPQAPDLTKLPPEIAAQISAVMKSAETTGSQNKELTAQLGELTKTVKSMAERTATAELVAKSEREFGFVPVAPAEIAKVLKSAEGAGPETVKAIEGMLKAVNETVQKSGLLMQFGSTGEGFGGGSAWQQIEQLADTITMKSGDGAELTKEQKVRHVMTKTAEGRALYREYLTEHPAQRARYGY